MMLNAHHDNDVNDDEAEQTYKGDADKWRKRGTEYTYGIIVKIRILEHCKIR